LAFNPGMVTEIPRYYAVGQRFYTKCYRGSEVCLGCLL